MQNLFQKVQKFLPAVSNTTKALRHGHLQYFSIKSAPGSIKAPFYPNFNYHFTRNYSASSQPLTINRPLPEAPKSTKYIRVIVGGIVFWVSALSLAFNYQKKSSSICRATLFAVKYHPEALKLLGSNVKMVDYAWISGDINYLKGHIDFKYWVEGERAQGQVIFKSNRQNGVWKPYEFRLLSNGKEVSLLEDETLMRSIIDEHNEKKL